ncbi:MAG TPA: hypothetical protein DEF00_05395 [Candidatus Taylorbacteria bacterium]|nr:hypothetical protein [Candidatus Taylorbacteria bacterium]
MLFQKMAATITETTGPTTCVRIENFIRAPNIEFSLYHLYARRNGILAPRSNTIHDVKIVNFTHGQTAARSRAPLFFLNS